MNKGIISFSFDDGRIDNYNVAVPTLRKYNLKATFNITTAYVDKTGSDMPFPVAAMTKENVVELFNDKLFEIAGHGDMHYNDYTDISNGINKLSEWLNDGRVFKSIGFASPGSDFIPSTTIEGQLNGINVKYVRISCIYKSFEKIKVLCRKASRVIKLPFLYKVGYMDTCFDSIDSLYIHSIPVLHQVTYSQLMAIINYACKNKKAVVLMLHSVVKKGGEAYDDNWSMDADLFERLCASLADLQTKGKCEVMTTMDIVNKLKKNV